MPPTEAPAQLALTMEEVEEAQEVEEVEEVDPTLGEELRRHGDSYALYDGSHPEDWDALRSDLEELQRREPHIVSFDVETSGLEPHHDALTFVQLGHQDFHTMIIDCRHIDLAWLGKILRPIMESDEWLKVGHNLSFDYRFLKAHTGVCPSVRVYDTMLAEKVIFAGLIDDASLADTVYRHLGLRMDKSVRADFPTLGDKAVSAEQLAYMALDVDLLQSLMYSQVSRMEAEDLVAVARLEFETLAPLAECSLHGVLIDRDQWVKHLEEQIALRDTRREALVERLQPYCLDWRKRTLHSSSARYLRTGSYEAARVSQAAEAQLVYNDVLTKLGGEKVKGAKGEARAAFNEYKRSQPVPDKRWFGPINLNSNEQLVGTLLLMGVPVPRTDAGKYTTEEENLQMIAAEYPIIEELLAYREVEKDVNSFGLAVLRYMDEEGRIHPDINQVVKTGRMSFRRPNLQQIPGTEIRKAFIAPPGYRLVVADYSQVELRILAHVTGERLMLDAFESGVDLHSLTAQGMFPHLADVPLDAIKAEHKEERHSAKTINFGIVYGLSPYGLAKQIGVEPARAEKYIAAWEATHPAVVEWKLRTARRGHIDGYSQTLLGRKRYFPPLGPKPTDAWSEEGRSYRTRKEWYDRMMCNHVIQGSSADITKRAICRIHNSVWASRAGGALVLAVHDELVYEVPEEYADEWLDMQVREMIEAAHDMGIDTVGIEVEGKVSQFWEK